MGLIKKPCLKCKNLARNRYKGLCFKCHRLNLTIIPVCKTLEEALNKPRKVLWLHNNNFYISVPNILWGHKVKLILADEVKDGN